MEDEIPVGLLIEDVVRACGHTVAGFASSAERAAEILGRGNVDAALLDVRLGGSDCFPVATRLAALGIPFGFITGYGAGHNMGEYRDRPKVAKPFNVDDIRTLLRRLLAPSREERSGASS